MINWLKRLFSTEPDAAEDRLVRELGEIVERATAAAFAEGVQAERTRQREKNAAAGQKGAVTRRNRITGEERSAGLPEFDPAFRPIPPTAVRRVP